MVVAYTDTQIKEMMAEPKHAPPDTDRSVRLQPKRGHKELQVDLRSDSGTEYRLILRENRKNAFDFSVILVVRRPQSNVQFRLRRHNGKSHEHTNRIEGNTIFGCHTHYATERYQARGMREDAYAEATSQYATFREALDCMIKDARIDIPSDPQQSLFEGGES